MGMSRGLWLRPAVFIAAALLTSAVATAQASYVVANDDTSIDFYTVGSGGALTQFKYILAPYGTVSVGGFFGANRIKALNSSTQQCIYASIASQNQVMGISMKTLAEVISASGSATDDGSANGIGLAVNNQYLYASFADSNTIGTFAVEAGCSLAFVGDVSVAGKGGGMINGMAIYGKTMITTFTDGTIQSFKISSGLPVSNNDARYSTLALSSIDASYPNSIDITQDGHYAIFGDTSSSMAVEVSDISGGYIKATTVYSSSASSSSSNVLLSPDQTVLYVVNTQGASVSAYFFNKTTGVLTYGCTSPAIRGQSSKWSYLGSATLINQTGTGGGVYVAEFGNPSGIAMVALKSTETGTCSLQEATQSPFADTSHGLVSVGTFPPRAF